MTDSKRTSASTGTPTPVDDGTPAGHPTPAGEPTLSPRTDFSQTELFPAADLGSTPVAPADRAVAEAIGCLVLAFGKLEHTTAGKLAAMRKAFGDVRVVGGRSRPSMQKLLAELRALVAMRDRHDKQALALIAEIDGTLQRAMQFRQLVLDGGQEVAGDLLLCRDAKNGLVEVPRAEIVRETALLDRIRAQIAAL